MSSTASHDDEATATPAPTGGRAPLGGRRVLAIVSAAAVITAMAGWAAAASIESPAERAASTAPPEPGPVAVPVESRAMSSGVVGRATVTFEDALRISADGVASGDAGGAGDGEGGDAPAGGVAVLTTAPLAVGTEVTAGDALFAAAGRPRIVLEGVLPAWRDLRGGDRGPDVDQLQAALVALGRLDAASGVYDAATADALAAVYGNAGFTAPAVADEITDAVTAASDALEDAQSAARAASAAAEGPTRSARLQAEAEVAASADAVESARTSRAQGIAQAERALESADRDVQAAKAAVSAARDELRRLRSQDAPAEEVALAQQTLRDAEAAVGPARDVKAEAKAQLATSRVDLDNAVDQAEAQLEIAEVQQQELLAGEAEGDGAGDGTDGGGEDPQRAVERARQALADARLDAVAPFVAAEVVFLPQLPRLVQTRSGEVGDAPSGSVLTLAGSRLTAEVAVPTADLDRITEGQAVTLDEGDLVLDASVTRIPTSRDGNTTTVTLTLTGEDLDADQLAGRNLRAVFGEQQAQEETLVVPLAALGSDTDGRERVLVVDPDDDTSIRTVLVESGEADGGMVQVAPLEADGLAEGDLVVVG